MRFETLGVVTNARRVVSSPVTGASVAATATASRPSTSPTLDPSRGLPGGPNRRSLRSLASSPAHRSRGVSLPPLNSAHVDGGLGALMRLLTATDQDPSGVGIIDVRERSPATRADPDVDCHHPLRPDVSMFALPEPRFVRSCR
jgi:hypothetical protein